MLFKKYSIITMKNENEEWFLFLIKYLLLESLKNEAHLKFKENYICDFSSPQIYVEKPLVEDIDQINIDSV